MTADQYYVEIAMADEPVQSPFVAGLILHDLGVQYDSLVQEDRETGIYLVGLLDRYGRDAARGDEIRLAEGDFFIHVF